VSTAAVHEQQAAALRPTSHSCDEHVLCRLQNQIKVKDRELDAARKEVTMLKSTASSHERCAITVDIPHCPQLVPDA
jgi:hypothetical protein